MDDLEPLTDAERKLLLAVETSGLCDLSQDDETDRTVRAAVLKAILSGEGEAWGIGAGAAINLRGAVISGDLGGFDGSLLPPVRFDACRFEDRVDFSRATFTGDAEFLWVTFCADAKFEGVTFTGAAAFSSATFNENSVFEGATFTGNANFGNVTFASAAHFGEAVGSSRRRCRAPERWPGPRTAGDVPRAWPPPASVHRPSALPGR